MEAQSAVQLAFPEPVRLIIWDLDETFWQGTLSEGGIVSYSAKNHELVIELAKRGILSSICSKNNYDKVKRILADKDIWEYFIFPSIDWTSKPERVASIVDATQLRPSTVLFLDDNPTNRAAVADRVPGIQVASPAVAPFILEHPLFIGKNDSTLERLLRYKTLEARSVELSRADDNAEFLRNSEIEVEIDVNIEAHLSRIVELINRTNQLNFTKVRLPEEEGAAVQHLKTHLVAAGKHASQAGLVRVKDRYGDYGYCGFFLLRWGTLVHYCFSCRILGFGVERWLYRKLRSPAIRINGEVSVDLHDSTAIDWINIGKVGSGGIFIGGQSASIIDAVGIRAGCEREMLAHYFNFIAKRMIVEGPEISNSFTFASDSLVNARFLSNATRRAAGPDMHTLQQWNNVRCRLFDEGHARLNILLTCGDFRACIYEHKTEGVVFNLSLKDYWGNLCNDGSKLIENHLKITVKNRRELDEAIGELQQLRSNFISVPFESPQFINLQRESLREISATIDTNAFLFVVLKHPKARMMTGKLKEWDRIVAHREFIRLEAQRNPRIIPIDIVECVKSDEEITDLLHYDRIVYFRLCQLIVERFVELADN